MSPANDISTLISTLRTKDPRLGAVMDDLPPYPGFPGRHRRLSHFHYLCRSIIYQQLATGAAATIYGRVRALGAGGDFPNALALLELSDETLRTAGLSRNKTRAVRDLSARVESGELVLRGIGRYNDEEIVDRLTGVWGIGEWTAQMFLMFKLGRLDVMPASDLGIQEGLKRLDELADRPKPDQVRDRSTVWEPYRSVASWYLWRLVG